MKILIIADHNNAKLAKATLHVVTAAKQISSEGGGEIDILILGKDCKPVAEQAAKIAGIGKILLCDDAGYEHNLAENIADFVVNIAKNYSHILTSATSTGKDFLPRAAALLDTPQVSEVIEIVSSDTFKHPIYAGNAIETVQVQAEIKILTIRHVAFDAEKNLDANAAIELMPARAATDLSQFVSRDQDTSDKIELTSARVVVSGGRGVGSKENFAIIEALAAKLSAGVGASRGAVDAGYIGNDAQVGQTGKIVAPELYIAVGISGQIQHIAGMKNSKIVVAINKDETAPIFEVADYGIVGDLFVVLPELTQLL